MSTKAPFRRYLTRHARFEHLESRLFLSATRATQAVNGFGVDLYEQLQHEQGNLFFSPLSVTTALAMTYAGAAGQTAGGGSGASVNAAVPEPATLVLLMFAAAGACLRRGRAA